MDNRIAIKRRFIVILGCLTGITALSIDMSLPSIPEMVLGLSSSLSRGQLIIGVFMAGIAIGQMPAGLLSDRVGRIPTLLCGIAIFIVAGVITTIAPSMEIMLLARFLQGLGGSVGVVVPRAIVRDIASGKEAASILSTMVMIFTLIPMLGPIIGGYLVAEYNWRAPFIAITILGCITLISINKGLYETQHIEQKINIRLQLSNGLKEFFRHKQSIIGMFLVVIPVMGYMSMITASSSLIIKIYNFPVSWFGLIFALCGFMTLIGSAINKRLLKIHAITYVTGLGTILIGIGAIFLMYIAWHNQASFILLWSSICLYMLGTGFVIANSTAIALNPVQKMSGIAASIIGTLQNICVSIGAIITSMIYNDSIRNTIIIMAICGCITLIIFLINFQKLKYFTADM